MGAQPCRGSDQPWRPGASSGPGGKAHLAAAGEAGRLRDRRPRGKAGDRASDESRSERVEWGVWHRGTRARAGPHFRLTAEGSPSPPTCSAVTCVPVRGADCWKRQRWGKARRTPRAFHKGRVWRSRRWHREWRHLAGLSLRSVHVRPTDGPGSLLSEERVGRRATPWKGPRVPLRRWGAISLLASR